MHPEIRDPLGRCLRPPQKPERLLSLVPSITELLFDLGLGSKVVGRTRFCIRPEGVRELPIIGGTKDLKLDKIHSLRPELVFAHKEENTPGQIEALAETLPVWVCAVSTIPEALAMIREVGRLCSVSDAADRLAAGIDDLFAAPPPCPPLRVAYLIWRTPWMVAGGDTFIHAML